jgi:hypothetical protein
MIETTSSLEATTDYDELGRPARKSRQMGPDTYEVLKTYDSPSGALPTP